MPNTITVTNLINNSVWQKDVTLNEINILRNDALSGNTGIPFYTATLIPVRTHNFKNFVEDFFLPTTINHALKVDTLATKIFALLGAIVLDILTLPVRLITCIPRVIYNACSEKHPLYTYLIRKEVDPKLVESDYVRVRLEWENSTRGEYMELNVNFIDLPKYAGSENFSKGPCGSSTYVHPDYQIFPRPFKS